MTSWRRTDLLCLSIFCTSNVWINYSFCFTCSITWTFAHITAHLITMLAFTLIYHQSCTSIALLQRAECETQLVWSVLASDCIIVPVVSPNMSQISVSCCRQGCHSRIYIQLQQHRRPTVLQSHTPAQYFIAVWNMPECVHSICHLWGFAAPRRPVWSVIGKCAELISSLSAF